MNQIIEFNNLDYAIIILIALSTLFGFFKGFVSSFLSFMGWILSFYISYIAIPYTKLIYSSSITNPATAIAAGYATSMILSFIFFGLLNIIISRPLSFFQGGIFDRLMGFIFGAVRGGAIVTAAYLIFVVTWNIMAGNKDIMNDDNDSYPSMITDSYTLPYLRISKSLMVEFFPSDASKSISSIGNSIAGKVTGFSAPSKTKHDSINTLPSNNLVDSLISEGLTNTIEQEMHDLFPSTFDKAN